MSSDSRLRHLPQFHAVPPASREDRGEPEPANLHRPKPPPELTEEQARAQKQRRAGIFRSALALTLGWH